jgi:hypothetical protein
VEGARDVRAALRLDFLELDEDVLEVAGRRLGRDEGRDAVAEQDQADAVVLLDHQVGDGGGQIRGVFELGHFAGAVAHRRAHVEQDSAAQVGLLVELLDVELVGLGPDLPVDAADVVAQDVLAVLGELDAEAVVGAAMQAGDEALDQEARHEVHVAQLLQVERIEVLELLDARHRPSPCWAMCP